MTLKLLAEQPERLWRFLGLFQPPCLRVLHALIISFVLLQFFSSWLMVPGSFTAWIHMWSGATLCLLAVVQTTYSIRLRGLRHFFPYLWGDVDILKHDIRESLHFKMVPPRPKGLGAVVQGLGLGALCLTAFTGLIWFWLWQTGSAGMEMASRIHDAASLLIILYFIGHGGMATLHFIAWQRHSKMADRHPHDQGSSPSSHTNGKA